MKVENQAEALSRSKVEDMAWIEEALAGGQAAYEKLMKNYQHIYNLIYRMIFKKEDVEDVTQEAFIKAFNSLHNFDKQFAFSTSLYRLATNNSIDYLRKKKLSTFSIDKDIESDENDFKFEIPDHEHIPDKNIILDERKKIIEEAIENLPAKYKKVIVMRHKQDKEYKR